MQISPWSNDSLALRKMRMVRKVWHSLFPHCLRDSAGSLRLKLVQLLADRRSHLHLFFIWSTNQTTESFKLFLIVIDMESLPLYNLFVFKL